MRTIILNMLTPIFSQAELDAIAYLVSWCYSTYPTVYICQGQDGGIGASYCKEDGTTGYFIRAHFDQDSKTYSFHS